MKPGAPVRIPVPDWTPEELAQIIDARVRGGYLTREQGDAEKARIRAEDRRAVEDNPARGPFPRPPVDPERTAEMVRAFFEGGAQERSRRRSR